MSRTQVETAPPAVCTACGCLCDDIELSVRENRIEGALHACPIGRDWFLQSRPEPAARAAIEGRPSELPAAIDHAVSVLRTARCPLVYGLSEASCETQSLAVDIAIKFRAILDVDQTMSPRVAAARHHGMHRCTLAELRHRADLVVIWRANPLVSHPRYLERYLGTDCMAVAVGQRSLTSGAVQHFLEVSPDRALDVLRLTLAAVRNVGASAALTSAAGFDPFELQDFVNRMRSCRFGVVLFDDQLSDAEEVDTIFALVAELNRATHWTTLSLGAAGNAAGALNVIAARTGQFAPVSFLDGSARHQADFTAFRMLKQDGVDALLLIAPHHSVLRPLPVQNIPTIFVGHDARAVPESAAVAILTATPGFDAVGTFHRADDVPLRLLPALSPAGPSDEEVLEQLLERLDTFRE